ncbi:MAG: hypothetical protein EX269_01160 [Acidimicrobiales bacterium]|nr:MAG: hypothetical protein EX269_01160 [Acidimicrobiales bacterium]
MPNLQRRASRWLIAALSLSILGTACTGDAEPTAASTTVVTLSTVSLESTAAPTTAPTTEPPRSTTTAPIVDDAPDTMAFVASRDLGRVFEIGQAMISNAAPSADAEAGVALTPGQVVRAARARLRTDGMWVKIVAVAPDSDSLGWVLDSALTPTTRTVQLSNTVRQGTKLETAAEPAEWLTIHASPAGDTVGTLGVGEQLVDTGGWALLEDDDVWIEVASTSGQVKGWVRSNAIREVVEVQPDVDGGSPSVGGSSATVDTPANDDTPTTTLFVQSSDS